MSKVIRVVLLALVLVGWAGAAQAIPVTWNLQGVTFDDGASATGFFDFDADTNVYSNYQISVTAGGIFPAFIYEDANSFLGTNNAVFVDFVRDDFESYITLAFDSALTNAGGFIDLTLRNFPAVRGSFECNNCSVLREITAGAVTTAAAAVPIPAPLTLFVLGLCGLLWTRRTRVK